MIFDLVITGCVARGYRKASGAVPYLEPGGTVAAQIPRFLERGLDIRAFHPATINLCLKPYAFGPEKPKLTLREVAWSERHVPEHFSFFDCRLEWRAETLDGLVYLPHPETKASHFHDASTLEILAPRLEGLSYGSKLTVRLAGSQLSLHHAERRIFHLLSADAWRAVPVGADYVAPSLASEGFVHCSELDAVSEVANRIFVGCTELLVLEIDPLRLGSPLIYELAENYRIYPHVYGPIAREAIVAVHGVPAGRGGFALPCALGKA